MSGQSYKTKILGEIQNLYGAIEKNVNQMDLENNNARTDMDQIAQKMKAKIDKSREVIEACWFEQ